MTEHAARFRDLAWLVAVEQRNRAIAMAAKLRNPRYLVGFLVGVGYFVLLFLPAFGGGADAAMEAPAWVVHVAPLGLAGLVLFWWVRGGYDRALAFRPEEVQILFTAPVKRGTLIRYKLLRTQAGVLISAVLVTFMGRGSLHWALTLPAAWALVATLHLHQLGASLVRVTAASRGRAGLRRAAMPLAVAVALGGALLWAAARVLIAVRSAETMAAALDAGLAALSEPAAIAALLPFRLLLDPMFAESAAAWAIAMVGALGLLVLHLVWVVRSDAAFEEAGAEAGRRRAAMIAAARSGKAWWRIDRKEDVAVRRWLRVPLRPTGEPAVALTWHQALAFAGDIRPTTLALAAAAAAGIFLTGLWASGSVAGAAAGLAIMTTLVAGFLLVIGPLMVRYDLRRDLAHLELLRSYPIAPRWLVAAELAAPVLLLTAIELALLGLAVVLLPFTAVPPKLFTPLALAALMLALNAPGLFALQVAVQNGLALLFPGWTRIGPTSGGGIDAVGQGILALLGALLAFAVLLVSPVLAALLIGASYAPALGPWAVAPAAMAFTGAVWAEVVWLARRLAGVYGRLDPVEAGLLR